MTVVRGYGGNLHFIAQSRSEIQRAYSDKETATIEENAIVKQYFGFSSFEECERISRAIGETLVQQQSYGFNSRDLEFTSSIGTGKDRRIPAERLMRDEAQRTTHPRQGCWLDTLSQGWSAPSCPVLSRRDRRQSTGRVAAAARPESEHRHDAEG